MSSLDGKKRRGLLGVVAAVVFVLFTIELLPSRRALPKDTRALATAQTAVGKQRELAAQTTTPGNQKSGIVANTGSRSVAIAERRSIAEGYKALDLGKLFQIWVESYTVRHDLAEQNAVGHVIAQRLRGGESPAGIYTEFEAFLESPTNPPWQKTAMYSLLALVRTNNSLSILISAAISAPTAESRNFIGEQLVAIASLGDGQFHVEFSPQLEAVWLKSRDRSILDPFAMAIARLGAPQGVSDLFEAAVGEDTSDPHLLPARDALKYIVNPMAVPVLAESLNQSGNEKRIQLAATALVAIGDVTAGGALINWAKEAGDASTNFISDLVTQSRTNQMLAAWESALSPSTPFKSESVRNAIHTGLERYYDSYNKK